jgi:broad specificity phosphatase PhoE
LSSIYLIRHGQAGTRDRYDELSVLGLRQAQLLGEYLAGESVIFERAFSGGLIRQRQTAECVAAAYRSAGLPFPKLETELAWNEFDLDHVYQEIAPQIAAEDESFRSAYHEMLEQVRASRGSAEAEVHRRWSPCDIKVVDAWIRARYPYSGESWEAFRRRVASSRPALNGTEGDIVVFTSATPTAVFAGLALDIHDTRVLSLAGALYNSSFTVLRLRDQQLRLFSFNNVPHLAGTALKTHR